MSPAGLERFRFNFETREHCNFLFIRNKKTRKVIEIKKIEEANRREFFIKK